jgi:alkylated DNA repair dioxygenase AlkB
MKLLQFKSNMEIPGLVLINDFITEKEEMQLLQRINSSKWNTTLKRRTQHYGYIYDYKSRGLAEKTLPIPDWCNFIIERLLENGYGPYDQCIVNEYTPGQGIAPHIDSVTAFEETVVSLSLASDIYMEFTPPTGLKVNDIHLKRRSAVCLTKDARYKWKHSIATKKYDIDGTKRDTRVSLTFRKIKTK